MLRCPVGKLLSTGERFVISSHRVFFHILFDGSGSQSGTRPARRCVWYFGWVRSNADRAVRQAPPSLTHRAFFTQTPRQRAFGVQVPGRDLSAMDRISLWVRSYRGGAAPNMRCFLGSVIRCAGEKRPARLQQPAGTEIPAKRVTEPRGGSRFVQWLNIASGGCQMPRHLPVDGIRP